MVLISPEGKVLAKTGYRPGGEAAIHLPGDYLSVYVPTTPNPTGGYFILVPRKNCHELDMSVDQALKYIISMGVVAPHDLPVKIKNRPGADSQH